MSETATTAASTPPAPDAHVAPEEAVSTVVPSFALPSPEVPAYALALFAASVLGETVDLFDTREIGSGQAGRANTHNRVALQNGRERIACTGTPGHLSRTVPAPLPDLLSHGALTETLALLRAAHPDWALALRSAARPDSVDGAPGGKVVWRQGWVVEIALQPYPMLPAPTTAVGFHVSPEVAVVIAALDMARAHDTAKRYESAVAHLEELILSNAARPPESGTAH